MTELDELKGDDIDFDETKEEESKPDDHSFDIIMIVIKTLLLIGIVIAITALLKYCGDFWTSFWGSLSGF